MMSLTVLLAASCGAAEWQWSAPVPGVVSSETQESPRAFLWIPPACGHVRAVVVGQHNMQEEQIFEHPTFRAAMGQLGFAIVWVTPGWSFYFKPEDDAMGALDRMMKTLADESGYVELTKCPVVPLGHSAAASYPWLFAAAAPERTLCAISVSGQWPSFSDQNVTAPDLARLSGVPGLVTKGEYENALDFAGRGLGDRSQSPHFPLSMLQEPGAGHFDASDLKVKYLGFYLKKAAQYRLRPDGTLKPIDPTHEGWLADRWRWNDPSTAPAAPVGKYTGEAKEAFWFFDEEMVRETERVEALYRGKKVPVIGFVQNGVLLQPNPKAHARYQPKFLPEGDGMTLRLGAGYHDIMPDGGPDRWAGIPIGSPVGHGSHPITIKPICGSVAQIGAEQWAVRFNRMGLNNQKRSSDFWLVARSEADDEYRPMVQQCNVRFWPRNKDGKAQSITFDPIPDQRYGVKSVNLSATADSGLPVYFYVREGPAEVVGDHTLQIGSIPPRSKFPVKVTVVAWQWGTPLDPKVQSAEPFERSFLIAR